MYRIINTENGAMTNQAYETWDAATHGLLALVRWTKQRTGKDLDETGILEAGVFNSDNYSYEVTYFPDEVSEYEEEWLTSRRELRDEHYYDLEVNRQVIPCCQWHDTFGYFSGPDDSRILFKDVSFFRRRSSS